MSRFFPPLLRRMAALALDVAHISAHIFLSIALIVVSQLAQPLPYWLALGFIAVTLTDVILWIFTRRQRNTAWRERDLANKRFHQACADITVVDNERLRLLAENQQLLTQKAQQAETILAFDRIETDLGVKRSRNGEQ